MDAATISPRLMVRIRADCKLPLPPAFFQDLHAMALAHTGPDTEKHDCRVVVLIPPAVDPGLPPINIKTADKNLLPSVRAAVSRLLKLQSWV